MRTITLDPQKLAEVGEVELASLDIKAIEQAAGWLAHWEYEENAEGHIPSPGVKSGTGYHLKRIQAAAEKLEALLLDDSPDGAAAADLSGGIHLTDELRNISDRANAGIERCKQETKQNPRGASVTTESRKNLVSIITRSWLDAGGSLGAADWLNNWDSDVEASPLIQLIQYVLDEALPNSEPLSPEQIRDDIRETEWFCQ